MKKRQFSGLSVIIILFFVSVMNFQCQQSTEKKQGETQEEVADKPGEEKHDVKSEEKSHGGVQWSYSGDTGPENWENLSESFATCGGNQQSPVDISNANSDVYLSPLNLQYKTVNEVTAINNGHSVQVNMPEGSVFNYKRSKYALKQFHFHTPSEHTITGEALPMEIHLVHVNDSADICVIGLMVVEGQENELLGSLIGDFPEDAGEENKIEVEFNLNHLLPEIRSYYNYTGSLTTPPCTEGVNWFVMKNAVEASADQIQAISDMMPPNNARPVQPLNDREILVME